jgi:thioredoxin reductase/Pyruvate/2-oxoacid:ferredoxin oxidoreductase delta subunit
MDGMDSGTWIALLVYGGPLGVTLGYYAWRRNRRDRATRQAVFAAEKAGLSAPSSLHPWIDPVLCLGCGVCVTACPESGVLAMEGGKACMVEAAKCVGHGACKQACPTEAITLVLGTREQGVEVPAVDPRFETSVPGLFVAGEIGGMGLIRNAIEQGRQVIESVRGLDGLGSPERLDVVIVGAGPAGFAASLAALEHGLRYRTLEQDCLGGTVARYPRAKLVLTAPVVLPVVGHLDLHETSKEALLELWERAERESGVEIRYGEKVADIVPEPGGFVVRSDRGEHRCRAVILAIGRRGSPRRLGVPGEEAAKVLYQLEDLADHRGERILVVGAGDSAIEAATTLADQVDTHVTLACRGDGFPRAKPPNRERVAEHERSGRVRVIRNASIDSIAADQVEITSTHGAEVLPNDRVLVCIGGELPTRFLHHVGIETEMRHGEP